MPLRLLEPTEAVRQMGNMVWLEDLEKRGYNEGTLLMFLESLHMPLVCSPLHDRDTYNAEDVRGWNRRHINPDTGEVFEGDLPRQPVVGGKKKPHYHIYYAFKGKRRPRDIAAYWADFVPEVTENRFVYVPDFDGAVRYCAHQDSPNKAQYDPLSIHGFTNVNMNAIYDRKNIDRTKLLLEIEQAIDDHGISNYYRLCRWAKENGDIDALNLIKGRTAHFSAYFNAMRQERQDRAEARKRGGTVKPNGDELIG